VDWKRLEQAEGSVQCWNSGSHYHRLFPVIQVLLIVRNYLLISLYSPSGGAMWLQRLYHWLTNCLQQSPARWPQDWPSIEGCQCVDDDVNVKGVSTEAKEANVKPTNRQLILTTEGSNYKRRATGKRSATNVLGGGSRSCLWWHGKKKRLNARTENFLRSGKYVQVNNCDYFFTWFQLLEF
jgi:hypothetical protein